MPPSLIRLGFLKRQFCTRPDTALGKLSSKERMVCQAIHISNSAKFWNVPSTSTIGGGDFHLGGIVFPVCGGVCQPREIPHLRPAEYKRSRLPRNRRSVNRAYGGVLSGAAVRESDSTLIFFVMESSIEVLFDGMLMQQSE
eukprot:Gb_36681 [translate_table: standard]